MIDLHHHLLYQLDDGAQSFEETQNMLREAYRQGITDIVATVHAVPGREFFDLEWYMRCLSRAQEWCAENGISIALHSGAEIYYTADTARLLDEKRIPTLAQSTYVLLEFPPRTSFEQLCVAAESLISHGYDPVFAHIERYDCLRRIEHIERLKRDYQVLMQVNAHTLLKQRGMIASLWMRRVLHDGLIDIVASDAHNMSSRKCCMEAAFEKITVQCGEAVARRIFIENAKRVVQSD